MSIKSRVRKSNSQSGDTLIEVLIAVAILSLATVMTMSVVNNSHREILGEINREAVRSEVNSQSELIQYFHDRATKISMGSDTSWAAGSKPDEVAIWDAIKAQALENPDSGPGSSFELATQPCGRGKMIGDRGAAFYLAKGVPTSSAPDNKRDLVKGTQFTNDESNPDAKYYVVIEPGSSPLNSHNRWSAKPGNGIWINAVHRFTTDNDNNPIENDPNDYYDFYIKACWLSPNSTENLYSLLVRVNNSGVG